MCIFIANRIVWVSANFYICSGFREGRKPIKMTKAICFFFFSLKDWETQLISQLFTCLNSYSYLLWLHTHTQIKCAISFDAKIDRISLGIQDMNAMTIWSDSKKTVICIHSNSVNHSRATIKMLPFDMSRENSNDFCHVFSRFFLPFFCDCRFFSKNCSS